MKVKTLARTSIQYPSEWRGTADDGREVIISYRKNTLSVKAGDDVRDVRLDPAGDRSSGQLRDAGLVRLMREHFPDIELPRG